MKKILVFALAVILCTTMAVSAFAAGTIFEDIDFDSVLSELEEEAIRDFPVEEIVCSADEPEEGPEVPEEQKIPDVEFCSVCGSPLDASGNCPDCDSFEEPEKPWSVGEVEVAKEPEEELAGEPEEEPEEMAGEPEEEPAEEPAAEEEPAEEPEELTEEPDEVASVISEGNVIVVIAFAAVAAISAAALMLRKKKST